MPPRVLGAVDVTEVIEKIEHEIDPPPDPEGPSEPRPRQPAGGAVAKVAEEVKA